MIFEVLKLVIINFYFYLLFENVGFFSFMVVIWFIYFYEKNIKLGGDKFIWGC